MAHTTTLLDRVPLYDEIEIQVLVAQHQLQAAIEWGNTAQSALGYVTYGMILCSAVGDIDTGYEFGQLSLQVLDKYASKEVQAKTMARFNGGVRHWKEPLQNTLLALVETYQVALETGDLEYAEISAQVYANHLYFSGKELTQVDRELAAYTQGRSCSNYIPPIIFYRLILLQPAKHCP